MVDTSAASGFPSGTKIVQGAVGVGGSASAAYGLAKLMQLVAKHWNLELTVDDAVAMIPLIAVFVHPFGMLFTAAMMRATNWVSGEST